ncbi:MAG: hypothetical protein NC301_00855 [Bacteroides sp.]|nr:hypothetical protein [Bacteroides sp.]MCM1378839.1 hypothetical protein [Bacteroides sp.]
MKKSYLALVALGVSLLTSCSQEQFEPAGTDGHVTFAVQLPAYAQSRAYAEADFGKTLYYAAYEAGNANAAFVDSLDMQTSTQTKAHFDLVKGKTYDFIFWADKGATSPYTFSADGRTVSVSYDDAMVNDDTRDAFFAVKKGITVNGPMEDEVFLRRPFAQINVGTSDTLAAAKVGIHVASTSLSVSGAYKTLDLYTGEAGDADDVVFAAAAPANDETFPVEKEGVNYSYLAMAYVLTGVVVDEDNAQSAQSEVVNITATITCDDGHTIEVPVPNAPIQRNFRTNIYGALLTSPFDWNVTIEPTPDEPAKTVEFDEQGYRVATSLEEAQALLAAGQEAVVFDGQLLTASTPAAAKRRSASRSALVEFLLNKSVKHQRVKILGKAAAPFSFKYADLKEGEDAAETNAFTLTVTDETKGIEVDLEGTAVEVKGETTTGEKVAIESLNITNAASASIDGSVAVDEVTTGEEFEGNIEYIGDVTLGISTVEDFVAALTSDGVSEINVKTDLDLTACTVEQLTANGVKTVILADDVAIQLGHENYFSINDDFTLLGNGTITNEFEAAPEKLPNGKSLIVIYNGDFTAEDVTLINDRNYHYHGSTWNSTCIGHYPTVNLTLNRVTAYSGMFTICCYNRVGAESIVNLNDCYLESNASTEYGTGNWAYCARISGKKSVVKNCTVVGIQGALAPDYINEMIIDGGDYYTHYLDEEKKTGNCYGALYVTGESHVTILDGKFYSPNTTTCVRSGDNDVNFPTGSITVKGGKYNYKPWNHITKAVYQPVEGYIYVENTGADADRYPWVVERD